MGPPLVINGVITPTKGLINWGYNLYKWSYTTLLITHMGPLWKGIKHLSTWQVSFWSSVFLSFNDSNSAAQELRSACMVANCCSICAWKSGQIWSCFIDWWESICKYCLCVMKMLPSWKVYVTCSSMQKLSHVVLLVWGFSRLYTQSLTHTHTQMSAFSLLDDLAAPHETEGLQHVPYACYKASHLMLRQVSQIIGTSKNKGIFSSKIKESSLPTTIFTGDMLVFEEVTMIWVHCHSMPCLQLFVLEELIVLLPWLWKPPKRGFCLCKMLDMSGEMGILRIKGVS